MINAHLAMTSYSIFGNIYAGGGLGVANNISSGLHIDTSGIAFRRRNTTAAPERISIRRPA